MAAQDRLVVLNTGFEEGLQGWELRGQAEFAVDPAEPHSGKQCARITVQPQVALAYQGLLRQFGPVAAGDVYQASLWVRSQGVVDGAGPYCAIEFLDGEGRRSGIAHSRISTSTGRQGWERLTVEGRTPQGTQTARIILILHAHGTAWFDDVQVVRTAQIQPWPDLGQAERTIAVHTGDVIHPRFGGCGFHVFDHVFPVSQTVMDTIVAKRWREVHPSFARLNHSIKWEQKELDELASYLLRMKATGTEVYLTTWDPRDTTDGAQRVEYAREVVNDLEYLVREKGCTNLKYYCMTNELSLGGWGKLAGDLPKFKDYHQKLFDELKARELDIQLLATDASPIANWHTIQWATENMDEITGIYGGHHYINDYALNDEQFYPWFLQKLTWGAGLARAKGKNFILGEFGCKQDGRVINGQKQDVCIYWGTPQEPLVGIQLSEAVIAALNAGVYALANWTFMDFPDYSATYTNKWGMFKRTGDDYSTRAHYYAYGLLTRFFRGPAMVFRVECNDPYVRAAAIRHHEGNTYSIAVINRYKDDVPVVITMDGGATAEFRKYVYDPRNVPFHPFGDLQPPVGKVSMRDGKLTDTIGSGTLTVYTTAYDEQPPAPVTSLRTQGNPDGTVRLTWQATADADLCYYRIYSGSRADFAPATENQIGTTVATEFTDSRAVPAGETHYKVVAVDYSGNAGPPAASR